MIHPTQSFINVEDVIIAKLKKKAEQAEARYMHHPKQGPRPKKANMGEQRDRDGRKAGSSEG